MAALSAVFSAFSFLSFIFVSIPFPWHVQAWNAGTCLLRVWTALASLNFFVNSVVWNGNTANWAPVWCDISTKLIIGTNVALPAASLCINRRLHYIATSRVIAMTKTDRLREVSIDLIIGVGIPVLIMALHYIVQGHRFDIFEDIGCFPFTYNTPPAYVIVQFPPFALALVSGVYSVLSICMFAKRHIGIRTLLLASKDAPSPNRYLQLMCFGGIEVLASLSMSVYAIYTNAAKGHISPWISWADTHSGFSRINEYPAVVWRSNPDARVTLEWARWSVVVWGCLFFGLFGFTNEARKHYWFVYDWGMRRFEWAVRGSSGGGTPNLAADDRVIYICREAVPMHGSTSMFFSTVKDAAPVLEPTRVSTFSIVVQLPPVSDDTPPPSASTGSVYSTSTAPDTSPPPFDGSQSFPRMTIAMPARSFLDLSRGPAEEQV